MLTKLIRRLLVSAFPGHTNKIPVHFAVILFFSILFCNVKVFSQADQQKKDQSSGSIHKVHSGRYPLMIMDTIYISGNPQVDKERSRTHKYTSIPGTPEKMSDGIKRSFRVMGAISMTATTISSTCGYGNGIIMAQASGGTPPYLFDIGDGNYYRNGYFVNIFSGNYLVTVTDANGVKTSVQAIVDNTYPPVKLTVDHFNNVTNCGGEDAGITLKTTGGVPPYQYSLDDITFQASNTFTNLSQGAYIFFVRDANGCVANFHAFDLGGFGAYACDFTAGFTYTLSTCTNDGDIIAKGLTADKPFTYSLDGINYSSNNQFSGLTSGLYKVYIKDSKGKIYIFAIPIYQDCSMIMNWTTTDAGCLQNDGTITVTQKNGTPPYAYTMDGLQYQSSNVFTGLVPGKYLVTVKDANNFTRTGQMTINELCPVVSVNVTNTGCGISTGTVTATGTNGTVPFTYSLDGVNYQVSNVFTGLAKGTYTVTVKDAKGFTGTANATVGEDCLIVTSVTGNTTCGLDNGTVVLTGLNGNPPYQYSIDGNYYQSQNTFYALPANSYTAYIKDANGQTGKSSFIISRNPSPVLSGVAKAASCQQNDGSVTLSATTGTPPYLYSMDGVSFLANNTFSQLKSGSYSFTVKDAGGCIAFLNMAVPSDCPIATVSVQDETCGQSNGAISATGSNGTSPYAFSLDGINFQSSGSFTSLHAGDYVVTIKDALNNLNQAKVSVINRCPQITVQVTNGLCGTALAGLIAQGSNGTPPYQFSLNGAAFQSSGNFSLLPSGTYSITIMDAEGLTSTTNAIVQNFPAAILSTQTTDATCTNNNGTVKMFASGGTVPLLYSIDGINYQSNSLFSNVPSGTYQVMVKDFNGCITKQIATVALTNDLSLNAGTGVTICEGSQTALTVASNADTYLWTPSAGLNDNHIKNVVASPGLTTQYMIIASLGICSKTDSLIVNVLPEPFVQVSADTTLCFGESMQLFATGGILYQWSPSTYLDNANIPDPKVVQPVQSTTYTVNVTGANGCSSLIPFSVDVKVRPPAAVFAGNDTSIARKQPLQLTASDVNHSGFTQYSWSPYNGLSNNNIADPVANPESSITYIVQASTPEGCMGTDTILVKVFDRTDIWVPNAFTPNGDGKNDILHAIPVGIRSFLYFRVYDRWGELVFQTNMPGQGWDGTLRGKAKPGDTFVWVASGIDYMGNTVFRKGTVILFR